MHRLRVWLTAGSPVGNVAGVRPVVDGHGLDVAMSGDLCSKDEREENEKVPGTHFCGRKRTSSRNECRGVAEAGPRKDGRDEGVAKLLQRFADYYIPPSFFQKGVRGKYRARNV